MRKMRQAVDFHLLYSKHFQHASQPAPPLLFTVTTAKSHALTKQDTPQTHEKYSHSLENAACRGIVSSAVAAHEAR
jgi:hypothetical protein